MSKLSWRKALASFPRIGWAKIRIQLSEVAEENGSARILTVPWTRPSPYRKREIIQGANDAKTHALPMPANARAILLKPSAIRTAGWTNFSPIASSKPVRLARRGACGGM
jgi:hypothetical protein